MTILVVTAKGTLCILCHLSLLQQFMITIETVSDLPSLHTPQTHTHGYTQTHTHTTQPQTHRLLYLEGCLPKWKVLSLLPVSDAQFARL